MVKQHGQAGWEEKGTETNILDDEKPRQEWKQGLEHGAIQCHPLLREVLDDRPGMRCNTERVRAQCPHASFFLLATQPCMTVYHNAPLPHSVDDEDKANQAGENVFAEHSHVLHQSTQVKDRHQDSEESRPHASPEVENHELQVLPGDVGINCVVLTPILGGRTMAGTT